MRLRTQVILPFLAAQAITAAVVVATTAVIKNKQQELQKPDIEDVRNNNEGITPLKKDTLDLSKTKKDA